MTVTAVSYAREQSAHLCLAPLVEARLDDVAFAITRSRHHTTSHTDLPSCCRDLAASLVALSPLVLSAAAHARDPEAAKAAYVPPPQPTYLVQKSTVVLYTWHESPMQACSCCCTSVGRVVACCCGSLCCAWQVGTYTERVW